MSIAIVFVGIDLAKNVFALHGVDEHGKAALVRPTGRRDLDGVVRTIATGFYRGAMHALPYPAERNV